VQQLLATVPWAITIVQGQTPSTEANPDFHVTNLPKQGDQAYVEYSVVDHTRDCYLDTAPGAAGKARDGQKRAKYNTLALNNNCLLYTATQEATGRMSLGYRRLLKACEENHDHEAFERTAIERTWASATFRQYYMQRIAIAFWTGSLAMHKRCASVNRYNAQRAPPSLRR
jgi:hypothetical protein